MHLKKPQSTQKNKTFVIVSLSSRSLAESATKTNNHVIGLDIFNDLDLLKATKKAFRINQKNGNNEFDNQSLLNTIKKIGNKFPIVYGSGFEDRPEILKKLQKKYTILGNTHRTVAEVKDPRKFFSVLKLLNINYPNIKFRKPKNLNLWIIKKIGGSGGHHVEFANQANLSRKIESLKGHFFQKFIKGRHYSAHFAASKTGKIMIGFTEQPQTTWEKLRKKDNPFLLKRSLYVHNFNRQFVQNISMQIDKIMSHFDLVGLNSIDFIVPKNSKRILITEINPRPGATIDLLERATGKNLFNLHIQSIRGENITRSKKNQKKNKKTWVMEIIYAKRNLRFNQPIHWPIWIKDIPNLRGHSNDRVHIKSGGPVCTIFADGNNRKSALKKLTNRVKLLNNNLAKHSRD